MPDAKATEETVRLAFVRQASSCRGLGSPFTASLCALASERLTTDYPVGAKILSWTGDPSPNGDSVPLRLAGALHALVLSKTDPRLVSVYPPNAAAPDDLWSAVEGACRTHETFILERLKSAPQTNEVRRSAALLPGFLTISSLLGKPLVLSEVGASAGLNLHWDHYDYRLDGMVWALQPSPVLIAPEWTGPTPPNVPVEIVSRAGCDLNPLNPARDEDALRLLSYIWADQEDRLERTRFALSIAAANRQTVERADAVDWLAQRLQPVHEGQVHVIYHTIAWQYLPRSLQEKGETLIAAAGASATENAPLARLQMEADDQKHSAALNLQIWPSGEKHLIGRADFHGRWVEWIGWPGQH
ncbi:DUF2332 family protein [Pararhizobium sp. BT-229]|uniref:DUF2332 domain-containing protein n=1 Tax=Pararhizobium sp. BT-229 TaxID=2986923 RepID=UPI0021F6B008|nr:DUF2332 family protein [Pararhizobium sp. BT-229]MCV9966515.1 DUF2332 family protein [Pararhizobium sp. BT-229]